MSNRDILTRIDDLPWYQLGDGVYFRVLRNDLERGHFVIILRIDAGATINAHKHYGPADFLMLKGALAYRDKVAIPGDYGWEALYAVHDATHVDEDTELLFIGHGPVIFSGADGRPETILDAGLLEAIVSGTGPAVNLAEACPAHG